MSKLTMMRNRQVTDYQRIRSIPFNYINRKKKLLLNNTGVFSLL